MLHCLSNPNLSGSVSHFIELVEQLWLTIEQGHHLGGDSSLILEPCHIEQFRVHIQDLTQFEDGPRGINIALHELKVQILVGLLEPFEDLGVCQGEFPLVVLTLYVRQILSDKLVKLCSLLFAFRTGDLYLPFTNLLLDVDFIVEC